MEKKPFEFESFTHVVFALNNPSDKSPYPHEANSPPPTKDEYIPTLAWACTANEAAKPSAVVGTVRKGTIAPLPTSWMPI